MNGMYDAGIAATVAAAVACIINKCEDRWKRIKETWQASAR
ncbi:hypothetical protein [Streptomyces sp. SAS_275]